MRHIKRIKCPYCGFQELRSLEIDNVKEKEVITCTLEEGGCEKDFVLETEVEVKASARKIEGE